MNNSPNPPRPSVSEGGTRADGESSIANETFSLPAGDTRALPVLPSQFPYPFGRYQLLKELGKGGMGAVYLAHDSQLDRKVALKIPLFVGAAAEAMRERFFREARAAATVEHPNICPIHDVGVHDGLHFLTMAYVEGASLAAHLRGGKQIPERTAAALVKRVAEAMHEAHSRGIIHRDLKPANIMLNRRRQPVVMDFGLARRSESTDVRLTSSGATMGTPSYMPPEQVNGDVAAMGPASDVYSLGVILYELLTGQVPFKGMIGELMAKILYVPPSPPSQLRPGLSPALDAICLRALQKSPKDRYPSMQALAADLGSYLAHMNTVPVALAVPVGATDAGVFASMVDELEAAAESEALPAPPASSRRRGTLIAGGLIGAALVILLTVVLVRTENGTVQIELSDPKADVEIVIDGNTITLKGPDDAFTLKPGPHKLEVRGRNFETVTDSFTIKRGEREIVKVTLKPREVVAKKKETKPTIKPSAQPDDAAAWDFREIHCADRDTFVKWYEKARDDGFSPCCINLHASNGEPMFNAVVVLHETPMPMCQFVATSSAELDEYLKSLDNQWRFQHVAIIEKGVVHVAATAGLSGNLYWIGNAGFVRAKIEEARRGGLRPKFWSTHRDGGEIVNTIIVPDQGITWKEFGPLREAELGDALKQAARDEQRLDLLSAYVNDKGQPRFIGTFIDNRGGPACDHSIGLSKTDFEAALQDRRKNRFRPHALVSWKDGEEQRYACAWLKMSESPRRATGGDAAKVGRLLTDIRIAEKEKRWSEMEAMCDEALKLDPRNVDVRLARHDVRLRQRRFADTAAEMTAALREEPKNSICLGNRAYSLLQIHDYRGVIRDIDLLLTVESSRSGIAVVGRDNRAWAYVQLGEWEKAIELYDESIHLAPQNALSYFARSLVHAALGNTAAAKADRQRAIDLDPMYKTHAGWPIPGRKAKPQNKN